MALPSAPAVSRCSSPLGVPSAAVATEAAQAPPARVQVAGRRVVTQGPSPLLWTSPSSAFSSVSKVLGGQAAEGGDSPASLFQGKVPEPGNVSLGRISTVSAPEQQAVDVVIAADVAGSTERGIGLQALSTDATITSFRGELVNLEHLHGNATNAGGTSCIAPELVNSDILTKTAEDLQEHLDLAGDLALQSTQSQSRFAHVDNTAGGTHLPGMNIFTEEVDISAKGIDAGEICSISEETDSLSATTGSQFCESRTSHARDVAGANKATNAAKRDDKEGTDNANFGATLMSDTGSTSPCTPSTAPSTEPSPVLCLSQPSPGMLVRSGQAALPPSITNCCFGQKSSNIQTEDSGDTRTCGDKQHAYEKGAEEVGPKKWTEDGKKQQYEESADGEETEKGSSKWNSQEKNDTLMSSATPSPAAGNSSAGGSSAGSTFAGSSFAGSGSLEEQRSEAANAQHNTTAATANVENASQQQREQNISPVLPSASCESTRSPTVQLELTATEIQGATACDTTMQGDIAAAAEDTSSVGLASQSLTEKEQMDTEPIERRVHDTAGAAAASEPVTLPRRGDSSNDNTPAGTGTEQAGEMRMQSHEEGGDSNGLPDAACFLQTLQHWETDADSRCNSLLSQLSIPLPAREKLLQNAAPLSRKSAEVADASSFLMSEIEARSTSPTPLLASATGASPHSSGARSNSSSNIKHAVGHRTNVAAGQNRAVGIPPSLIEYPRVCGHASSPTRHRSTRGHSDALGRRGGQQIQQQQPETFLRGRYDTFGGGIHGPTHECHHDVHTCRSLSPAAAVRGHSTDVNAKSCHMRGTPGGEDMPAGETSNDLVAAAVAAAAAQVLQHQMRHQVQQQQHPHDQQETSTQQADPRQQNIRALENWTRSGAAAALEDVLSQSSAIAGEGHTAADEESVNIRRWFESFGIAGRGAETAVAAVVKRAVDLQRRLATLLTVTLRQQLNQRLLVLALAILLEKHRREPVRCEEMLREQQRLLRVLETQQQQALADLPHLYGDLPEAQQLQQQLQQLREAEWQLRTGGDRFAAAQAAAEEQPCLRLSRAAEICSLSSSHRLPGNSMRMARSRAAAAASEGSAHTFYASGGLLPCTSAMAEGDASRWTLCTHNQAERKGRLAERESHFDIPMFSTTTEVPGGGVLPPRTKYLESLTNGSTAEAAVVLSRNVESRSASATVAELRASRRHSRQTNSSTVWRDSEAPSEEKEASESEGSVRQQIQQPMVERFLAKQIERCLAGSMSNTQDTASASSGPRSTASTTGVLEAAGAAAGTTKESWRSGRGSSNSGTFEDEAAVTVRERPARNSITAATLNSPARVCTGNSNARSDALPEQGEGGLTARATGAGEGSIALSLGAGRHSASAALRGAAAAGGEICSPRPVETAADAAAAQGTATQGTAAQGTATQSIAAQGTAGQGAKGLILPVTRSQAAPVQSSHAENSALSGSSSFTSGSGSEVAASGNFTSVYSRGSNARHQNDPYPHNVMIQLIQPLPTGIKLELKSHRPASLAGAQGLGVLGGSSNSVTSVSSSNIELPAPREYALRVSLTRHETKYCSFHSLHGILPAYNEAVRLRNKFAGLPFVLPTMTLEELHQRKEQLDAGRPLPGHGPHEAFMTVQERITYYKQTGMSSTNVAKAENASGSAASSSVFGSPRSASPVSSAAPAGGRSSQHASPLAPGNAGSSKARSFRSPSTSSPGGADGAASASPAELDSEQRGRSSMRGASGEDHQHHDQTRVNAGRGGGISGGKRGRTSSILGGGQQEHQSSWPSTTPHSMTQQQQQLDGDRMETTLSKNTHASKVATRGGKVSTCRPAEEGPGPATSHERKMQLRSRTTSSSGSRSDYTTISSVTETEGVKETSGAAEYRNKGEKRRKISNAADDVIQCFLQRNFYKSSSSDPDDGLLLGRDSGHRQAGIMAEAGRGGDSKQTLARNGGTKGNGSGGRGNPRCPWDEMVCWNTPLYTQQSPGETAAVGNQSSVDTGLPTAQDVQLLAQEVRTGNQLSSMLDKELLIQQRGGARPSPRRSIMAFMSSRRDTLGEDEWLASLHAGDRRSSDGQAGHEVEGATEEEKRTKFRGLKALPAGSSNSGTSRKVTAEEASALLGLPRTNIRRGGATAEYRDDNGGICAPSGNSARKNSNGAPVQKVRSVRESVQDSTWARDYEIRKTQESENARHVDGGMASASENARDEKKGDAGEQEVDVNEEEARHLSELLLGTGMFVEMSRCSDEAEKKRLAREETRTAQRRQSRIVDTAAIPSVQQQM